MAIICPQWKESSHCSRGHEVELALFALPDYRFGPLVTRRVGAITACNMWCNNRCLSPLRPVHERVKRVRGPIWQEN
jgi:hypothetical protein